jgi:hypothetical protein
MNTLRNAFAQQNYPVGSFYTQYPESGQSTVANMFPATKSPAVLFGGTWTERFASEDVFFRTGALGTRRGQIWNDSLTWNSTNYKYTTTGATIGIEPDAVRNITGRLGDANGSGPLLAYGSFDGAFQLVGANGAGGGGTQFANRTADFNASRVVPTDTTNHPKNRLIKVWERTA